MGQIFSGTRVYDTEGQDAVVAALDLVLARLSKRLKEYGEDTSDDSIEHVVKVADRMRRNLSERHGIDVESPTSEELEAHLSEFRDDTARNLGQIEGRILEIRKIKEGFAGGDPESDMIDQAHLAIRNSLLLELLSINWESQPDLRGDAPAWTAIRAHAQALQDGFGEPYSASFTDYPFDFTPDDD